MARTPISDPKGAHHPSIHQALRSAAEFFRAGQLAQAEALVRQVIGQAPRQPDALHLLGSIAEALNRLDDAAEAYRSAVDLKPSFAEGWNSLGRVLLKRRAAEEAVSALQRALSLKPGMAEIHFNLGNALSILNRLDDAAAHFRRTIELKPDNAASYYNLGNLLQRQSKLGEAAEWYEQAVARAPDYLPARYALGRGYLQLDKPEAAVGHLERVAAMNPAPAEARYDLGKAYVELGRMEDAAASFRAAALRIRLPDGITIAVPPSLESSTTYSLLEQERWFEKELDFVRGFLQPGMIAIDIGANFGVYALPVARLVGPGGRVFAYEPGTEARTHLELSRELNGLANLHIDSAALSDHAGEGRLNFATMPECRALGATDRGEAVRLTTLDGEMAARHWNAIDFLKIDAEGEEARILSGGRAFFSQLSPLVMFEIVSGRERNESLRGLFTTMDYHLFRQLTGAPILVPVEPAEPLESSELNLFAAKPDRIQTLFERNLLVTAIPDWVARTDDGDKATAFWRNQSFTPAVISAGAAAESSDADYQSGLTAYAVWRDSFRPASERCAALAAALLRLRAAYRRAPSPERASTLARVAWEWGARREAAELLREWVPRLINAPIPPTEPLWPASPRYDALVPDDPPGVWFAAAAAEQLERASSHSSVFNKPTDSLGWLCQQKFASAEMERRRTLYATRLGVRSRVPEKLFHPTPEHLNADLWREGKVPGTVV